MHLFKAKILLYLSFNVIGYFFMFISIRDVLLTVAWKGIPVLLFASVAAFYFQYLLIGRLCSITSMALGLGVFLSMIGIYWTQSRKG